MTSPRPNSRAQIETVSGLTAGAASTLLCHPLDLLKTRLQLSTGPLHLGSSLALIRQLLRTAGPQALYRGLTPNLLGNTTSWGLYFLLYSTAKEHLHAHTAPEFLLASGAAGVVTAVATNPVWVIKTRMLGTDRMRGGYSSVADGVRRIWREEGARGYWRGLVPAVVGVSHGALQFMVYERLKQWRRGESETGIAEVVLGSKDFVVLSGAAKVSAGCITYPYRVVQTRMQNFEMGYTGPVECVRKIWKGEGVRGFYKGLAPTIVRVLPSTCITFLVYENVRVYMGVGA